MKQYAVFPIIETLPPASAVAMHRAIQRVLLRRGVILTDQLANADYILSVSMDDNLSDDSYRIVSAPERADLTAASVSACFAAVGKWLRLCQFDGMGGFLPPSKEADEPNVVSFTPKHPVRGMYFATHFHNFYHNAPMERVWDVIEDLAMRGANSLLVWFDMHHYTSMRDPAAVAQVERLRGILQYANTVGMGGAMTMLSNEGFAESPLPLRAEWEAQNGYFARPDSHYHVEICPSKEGGDCRDSARSQRNAVRFL